MDIEPIMWRALGINSATIFLLTLFFLKSLPVAAMTVLMCAMIVVEIYGIMMTFVQYNTFVATGLIACSGIAIEFCAHVAASFSLTKGTTEERIGAAMKHTFMAIILGSLSTLLAICPLAFHWMDFIILYQFLMFALLVVVGMINGMVFLPAMLAMVGSLTEGANGKEAV